MKVRNATRSLLAIIAVALGAAVAACTLPEDPYRRFQLLDGTEYRNLRWIYERSHVDPRPIDIAILGSSRVESGIDARRLETMLRAAGTAAHVENFGIPYDGRNLDLVIARELLTKRRPKLLVIGVPERPSLHTHVTFKYVASSRDVVSSIGLGNIDYLADLAYLPYRHLKLFWAAATHARVEPVRAGNEAQYDPDMFFGREPGGRWRVNYPQRALADIEHGARRSLAQRASNPLGNVGRVAAWSAERRNITAIAALAKARGVAVVFVFIPQYMSDRAIAESVFYRKQGPLLDASFLSTRPDLYTSWGHLNARGAAVVDTWLYRELSAMRLLPAPTSDAVSPAGGGTPRAR